MIKEILKKIETSKEFKNWKKVNKSTYLTSIFKIQDNTEGVWQAGYYNPDNDQITTITVNEEIDIAEQQEIAKFNKEKIEELNISKLKIEYDKAIEIATKLQEEKYSADVPIKKIIILQNMNPYGNIWNITFFTISLKVINIKIEIENGTILEHKATSFTDFRHSSSRE